MHRSEDDEKEYEYDAGAAAMMMETMSRALDRAKMLVGMESDEESLAQEAQSSSFFDEFDRNCTLSTKQVLSMPHSSNHRFGGILSLSFP